MRLYKGVNRVVSVMQRSFVWPSRGVGKGGRARGDASLVSGVYDLGKTAYCVITNLVIIDSGKVCVCKRKMGRNWKRSRKVEEEGKEVEQRRKERKKRIESFDL